MTPSRDRGAHQADSLPVLTRPSLPAWPESPFLGGAAAIRPGFGDVGLSVSNSILGLLSVFSSDDSQFNKTKLTKIGICVCLIFSEDLPV